MSHQTRDLIQRKALELFAEKGVDAVSVRDIATAAGMSPSNLYSHYRGREELVGEMFRTGYAAYGKELRGILNRGGKARERLSAMVRRVCALHDEDPALFRFLLMNQHSHLKSIQSGADDNPVDVILALADDGIRAGEFSGNDPLLITSSIVGIVVQYATFVAYGRLPERLSDAADALTAACLRITG